MLYAFSIKHQHAFIVSAENAETLAERLDNIQTNPKYAEFTVEYISPGIFILEADNLRTAKRMAMRKDIERYIMHPDLPLFRI